MIKKNLFKLVWRKLYLLLSLWLLNHCLNLELWNINLTFTKYASLLFMQLSVPRRTFRRSNFIKHSILDKRVSAILQKSFGFNFICILVFFQNYPVTSVEKNPKIYVKIYYFTNRRHTFIKTMLKSFSRKKCWKLVINTWR